MTGPDQRGPVTAVAYVRAGAIVARTEVPGRLLEIGDLPRSVQLQRQPGGEVHIVESPDPLLECCGQLPLPWVNRFGPGLSLLDVPPPWPFTNDDITTMWQARNRLVNRRRPKTSGDAAWSSLQYSLGESVDWSALEDAVGTAGKILAAWPVRPVPTVTWLPLDRPGGRVLVGLTERSQRSHGGPVGIERAPAKTARRSTDRHERRLHALAAIAALLADRLSLLSGLSREPEIRDRLVGLFRQVARRSNPCRPVADPPASAWPGPLAATYTACLRALSSVRDVGPGIQNAPLSEVWELYQAWTAESLRAALETTLGASAPIVGGSTCLGRWTDGTALVELHYEPRIPGVGTFQVLGQEYVAAVSDLVPDLLLARSDASSSTAVVIDAKKRSIEMAGDDLSTNASKYLWGIRRAKAPGQVPVIAGAVMVSPLGGPQSALDEGRADVFEGHPSLGLGPKIAPVLLDLLRLQALPQGMMTGWHAEWA